MATFIITNKERERATIQLLVNFRGHKYKKGIGESVNSKFWSQTKKRVKVSAGNREASLINEKLDLWEKAADETVSYFKEKTYIPESDEFFKILEEIRFGKNDNKRYSLDECFGIFIDRYTGVLTNNCLKQYKLARGVLDRYCKEKRCSIYIDSLPNAFYNKFLKWFYAQGYSVNYFGTVIKDIKRVMTEARDVDKLVVDGDFTKFVAPAEDADNIYLTEEELLKMYHLKIDKDLIAERYPDLAANKRTVRARAYSKARDMFLIGAFTGLRFSDFSRIAESNISKSDVITIMTQKTGKRVVIPIHWVVREIIEGGYDFSTTMANQKLNDYIKEVAYLAGIDDEVMITKNIGGRGQEIAYKKYELVCTHTARRSFATNAYKAGVPTIAIM